MFFQLWLIDWFVRPVTHNPSSPSKLLVLKSHTRNLEAIACILFCPSFRPWMHDRLAKFLVRDSVPVTCTENLGRVSWALAYVTLCHAWFTLSVVNSSINLSLWYYSTAKAKLSHSYRLWYSSIETLKKANCTSFTMMRGSVTFYSHRKMVKIFL